MTFHINNIGDSSGTEMEQKQKDSLFSHTGEIEV